MKRINITAGECLNEILISLYKDEYFIPFNEAMIKGEYQHKLFSGEFNKERSLVHGVSTDEYEEKLKGFLLFLKNISAYDEVVLWFGEEDFCNANKKTVLETLEVYSYRGKITLNTVDEETGTVLKRQKIR